MIADLPILAGLIHRTRRQALWRAVLDRAQWAAAAALVSGAFLLVFGTGVVAWYLPLVVFVLALPVALWTLRGRLPRDYAAAQTLDRVLGTSDLLSSAWHAASVQEPSRFAPLLLRQAEDTARAAGADTSLPWRWQRSSRYLGGAAVVTLALFGLRYGMLRTLDLSGSVVSVMFDTFTGQAVAKTKPNLPPGAKLPKPELIGLNAQGDAVDNNVPEDVLKNYEVSAQANAGARSNLPSPNQQDQRDSGEVGSPEEGNNTSLPEGAQGMSTGMNQQKSSDVKNPPRPDSRQKQDPSLLDKMRDALASMMDKLRLNKEGSTSKQNSTAQESQTRSAQRQSEKGATSPGKPQQGDPQSGPTQEQADSSQQGQTSQSDAPSQGSNDQQHSGVGKQDGSKNTELAKDAQALGKLSELLGKRSMNLHGEMMVEVENTRNPQLRTPYLNRGASHGEAGGDLSRDEVPLRHQEFVRRYYEQVRKQPDSLVPVPHKAAQ